MLESLRDVEWAEVEDGLGEPQKIPALLRELGKPGKRGRVGRRSSWTSETSASSTRGSSRLPPGSQDDGFNAFKRCARLDVDVGSDDGRVGQAEGRMALARRQRP